MASQPSTDHNSAPVLASLSRAQRRQLEAWQAELAAARTWTASLPIALLDRCWLRLWQVPVDRLAVELPPDASADVPELVRYRQLVERGHSNWDAEQYCWEEFGCRAWRQALRHHWLQRERDAHSWTLERYLDLLSTYRRQLLLRQPRRLPLLVLGRTGSREPHRLLWLQEISQSIRHTCA